MNIFATCRSIAHFFIINFIKKIVNTLELNWFLKIVKVLLLDRKFISFNDR